MYCINKALPTLKKKEICVGKREGITVQEAVSLQMLKFVTNLNKEFFVGIVLVSVSPLKAATQQVEIQVSKVYCIKGILTKNGGVCGGYRNEECCILYMFRSSLLLIP